MIEQRQHPEYDHLMESAESATPERRYSLELTRAEAEAIQAWAAATLALPGAPEVAWQVFESLRAVLEEEAPTG